MRACGRTADESCRLRWQLIDGEDGDGLPTSFDFCIARCLAEYANKQVAAE